MILVFHWLVQIFILIGLVEIYLLRKMLTFSSIILLAVFLVSQPETKIPLSKMSKSSFDVANSREEKCPRKFHIPLPVFHIYLDLENKKTHSVHYETI